MSAGTTTITSNHPIQALSLNRRITKDSVILDNYQHFDNIRRYLQKLAIANPYCISRTGRKTELKCSCCTIFTRISTVTCAVASYLMHFGKLPKTSKQFIILEWIKSSLDKKDCSQKFRLPYLPFLEYECDALKEEGVVCYDLPTDIFHSHYVCKTAIMNVIGVGITFWKACHQMLTVGPPKPNALIGNHNASKTNLTDQLDIFFITIKEEISESTTIKSRNNGEETKVYYLPSHLSKRKLYEMYCYQNGHIVKLNHKTSIYAFTNRNDIDVNTIMDVLSWFRFQEHWKNKYPNLKIRNAKKPSAK